MGQAWILSSGSGQLEPRKNVWLSVSSRLMGSMGQAVPSFAPAVAFLKGFFLAPAWLMSWGILTTHISHGS